MCVIVCVRQREREREFVCVCVCVCPTFSLEPHVLQQEADDVVMLQLETQLQRRLGLRHSLKVQTGGCLRKARWHKFLFHVFSRSYARLLFSGVVRVDLCVQKSKDPPPHTHTLFGLRKILKENTFHMHCKLC